LHNIAQEVYLSLLHYNWSLPGIILLTGLLAEAAIESGSKSSLSIQATNNVHTAYDVMWCLLFPTVCISFCYIQSGRYSQ